MTVYSRGGLCPRFVREINKRFPDTPGVVLFRTASRLLTLAFVQSSAGTCADHPARTYWEESSLIREIDLDRPHRAHLDILSELSLDERRNWMDQRGRPQNFDGLLGAWLDALDTEELNRRFYNDLFTWFNRAVKKASFPTKQRKTLKPEEHVIRLTNAASCFVWFIKEKGDWWLMICFIEKQGIPAAAGLQC